MRWLELMAVAVLAFRIGYVKGKSNSTKEED